MAKHPLRTVLLAFILQRVLSAEDLHPLDHRRYHLNDTESVFWGRIEDQQWASSYRNPCGMTDEDESYASDPIVQVEISSLDVQGREDALRAMAGNLLSRLRHLERFVAMGECSEETITSLPPQPFRHSSPNHSGLTTFGKSDLERLYSSFLYASVHFRFMAQDWQLGRACGQRPSIRQVIISSFQRNGQDFEHAMCMLLAPTRQGFPYPNSAIQERILFPAMTRDVLHYLRDCVGRTKRDCIVHRFAETLLQNLLDAANNVIRRRRS